MAGLFARENRERVGIYLLGVAIGCLLLGLFWAGRAERLKAREAAEQAARHPAPDGR